MPKLNESQLRDRARLAAVEAAPKNGVGDFLTQIEEDENVYTFLFAAKMKGYVGWTWSVSLFANDEDTSVSEVNLMPGEDSLIAPNWVPWSERLADYKALQVELEAQAALEAEENGTADEDDEDSEEATESEADEAAEAAEDLAATLTDVSPDAEQNADDTGGRIPRFLRRRLGRLKHKK
ncbi:MAG: DUF3027 domain-containing protein [Actinobacteria bacterium]|uniref:Unannotated protein n=1 Tax=freshwater metagenome TaxID=449393 RepID=A0A6J6PFE6_9ZZZZ|nr:DUF3027 domain-containing protein [Actinomycetota bacterium]